MKSLIVCASVLFAANAWACPDLQGTYLCDEAGFKSMITITQETVAGDTTYYMNGTQIVADGIYRETNKTTPVGQENTVTTAYCQDNALQTHTIWELVGNEGEYRHLETHEKIRLETESILNYSRFQLSGEGQEKYNISCTRL